ncbi:hypothetical protein G6F22_014096 [Rhizopus arrhizus]|nr:hypothetical protein G6F22_014096 [Rhizopus arrhizus]
MLVAGAAMHGQRGDAAVLGNARDQRAIAVVAVPAGADLQRDRHVHRVDHRFEDARHQLLVAHQRRARPGVAHLLGRAAHVDVDDLRTVIDVVARRLGQLLRLGAGDLHADRCRFAVMVHAVDRLARVPEARVADGHFRGGQARAQPFAQQAEGLVGDAGHGRQHDVGGNGVRADLHAPIVGRGRRYGRVGRGPVQADRHRPHAVPASADA